MQCDRVVLGPTKCRMFSCWRAWWCSCVPLSRRPLLGHAQSELTLLGSIQTGASCAPPAVSYQRLVQHSETGAMFCWDSPIDQGAGIAGVLAGMFPIVAFGFSPGCLASQKRSAKPLSRRRSS